MLYYPESQKGNFDRERYFLNHSCKNRLCINPEHLYLEENKNSRQIIKANLQVIEKELWIHKERVMNLILYQLQV